MLQIAMWLRTMECLHTDGSVSGKKWVKTVEIFFSCLIIVNKNIASVVWNSSWWIDHGRYWSILRGPCVHGYVSVTCSTIWPNLCPNKKSHLCFFYLGDWKTIIIQHPAARHSFCSQNSTFREPPALYFKCFSYTSLSYGRAVNNDWVT